MGLIWDAEMDSHIQRLWAQGYSAQQIYDLTGYGSRSAVLGRLHRTGKMNGGNRKAPQCDARRATRPRSRQRLASLIGNAPVSLDQIQHEWKSDGSCLAPWPPAARCRFMLGNRESAHAWCGEPTGDALVPFCADHARICYQPLTKRSA